MNDDALSSSESSPKGQAPAKRFPTVGIGSSAGGVHALQQFFESLPDQVDAAFVVVVHLDPAHQSELPAILAARTRMPVAQVSGRVPLEPRRVYVIPPNRQLFVTDQHLAIAEFEEPRWRRAPIDLFFRSLAAQRGDDFAIIFSGAGSDGALGIKAVKEAGGIILVQDPDEAEYGSMPRSAIATGFADFVLPVREIAARLPELIANRDRIATEPEEEADVDALKRILSHLRIRTGHDFLNYRKSTVRRRIARRMQVRRAATMTDYLSILRDSGEEAQALLADLLISVTTFFRDSEAFDRLASLVMPHVFENKGAADAVRVWVPGCATGEEAYSIAILLLEEAGRHDVRCEIQVFASDLDDAALTAGREGRYPLAIEADMTEERVKRFFTREADHYRVSHDLRDVVLFAKHSLLKDPPFSRVDLVSCRNVLIYLERELQQQVCATLHFALNPSGYLFLGASESADSPVGMFRALDREARIYQRMPASSDGGLRARIGSATLGLEPHPARAQSPFRPALDTAIHREALERLAPPSVLVDETFRVANLSETAGRYLQPSAGPLVNDIAELVREELRTDLRAVLHTAFSRNETSLSGPIGVRFNGAQHRVYLQARPVGDAKGKRSALVFFLEGELLGDGSNELSQIEARAPDARVQQLLQELQFTRSAAAHVARGIRGRQRGVARRQRGVAVDQRGVSVDRRGARNQQGGAAVDQRGIADRQQRAEGEAG